MQERGLGELCRYMVHIGGRALLLAQGHDTRMAYNIADTLLNVANTDENAMDHSKRAPVGGGAKEILLELEEEFK